MAPPTAGRAWFLLFQKVSPVCSGAIRNREPDTRDKLLAEAQKHRIKELPEELDKCPVKALSHDVTKGRLGPGVNPDIESPTPASAQADGDLPQVHAG